jgi:hypothetical protein
MLSFKKKASDSIPKVESTFGSEALERQAAETAQGGEKRQEREA